jgi:hypothetical protein
MWTCHIQLRPPTEPQKLVVGQIYTSRTILSRAIEEVAAISQNKGVGGSGLWVMAYSPLAGK